MATLHRSALVLFSEVGMSEKKALGRILLEQLLER